MWIERTLTPRLASVAGRFPALVLTGARQVGKTALLRHAFPRAAFLSLDLPSAALAAETTPDTFLGGVAGPVILDEVQYAPGLFRYLKAAIDADRHSMGRFLMTGSQKFALMEAVSESLAGRCAVLELGPLAAHELGEGAASVEEMVWRGGFPELWREPDPLVRDFHTSYVVTYLERDVRSALRVGSLRDFERFLRACALRSGNLLNLSELARDVGIAGTTARDWLSVLEASGIVVLLEPWFGSATKRLVKTPKLYLRDSGLCAFLLGIDSAAALARSPFVGALWEAFVLGELLSLVASRGSAARVLFYRDVHGAEVDFAVERDGLVHLVEAKWTETVDGPRLGARLAEVARHLGGRAAAEAWVICRTRHGHRLPGLQVAGVHGLGALFDG